MRSVPSLTCVQGGHVGDMPAGSTDEERKLGMLLDGPNRRLYYFLNGEFTGLVRPRGGTRACAACARVRADSCGVQVFENLPEGGMCPALSFRTEQVTFHYALTPPPVPDEAEITRRH